MKRVAIQINLKRMKLLRRNIVKISVYVKEYYYFYRLKMIFTNYF